MNVEIAICTWNRAESLRRTLHRLTEIDVPGQVNLRCIAVDNNSTDDTIQVIGSYVDQLEITVLKEPEQGHVFARNKAVSAARGDLLLWIDDDVIVGENWFNAYVVAAYTQPNVSFWGGPIVPRFAVSKPGWIDKNWEKLKGCFASRQLGESQFEFTSEVLPYGANFAIRTAVQKNYPFHAGLGRKSDDVSGDDELKLFRQLIADGHQGNWIPAAGVDHVIDPSRTSTEFIGRYFVGQGHSMVAHGQAWTSDAASLENEAAHELFWFRIKRFFTRSEVWLSHLIRGSLAKGQAQALRKKTR